VSKFLVHRRKQVAFTLIGNFAFCTSNDAAPAAKAKNEVNRTANQRQCTSNGVRQSIEGVGSQQNCESKIVVEFASLSCST
jgi:hypothetical protein